MGFQVSKSARPGPPAGREKDGRTQVAMRIGGTPWESEVDMVIACCIMTVLSTLITIGQVYETRLHTGEVVAILRSRLESNIAFLQEYFVDPRLKAGIDASALTEGYKKLRLMLEEMENIVRSWSARHLRTAASRRSHEMASGVQALAAVRGLQPEIQRQPKSYRRLQFVRNAPFLCCYRENCLPRSELNPVFIMPRFQ